MFENGSEVIRADFHLHTKADKEFLYSNSSDMFVNDYVEALEANNIKVGVITNHNKFDLNEYKAIRKEASKRGILILPGVELSVKEGARATHTLVVFNPDEWLKNGEDFISRALTSLFLGISNPENENTHCNKDFLQCIKLLDGINKDYFVIFAHVEQSSGLWEECNGAIITPLSASPEFRERVYGFQKVRTREKARVVHEWMGYDIASVEGSDPKSIAQVGKGDKKTYIKIGELSYSAVKYALQDYKSRILSEYPTITHGYIKKVRFLGGKLDGQIFGPSSELNTLIGIRGSGKSSILEVIRYALEIEASKQDNDYKTDLVKSVLGSGGTVELTIVDKHKREYTVSRILGERSTVKDESGRVLSVSVGTVLNNPLYFGQKDLALTRAGYELELLNKLVGASVEEVDEKILLVSNKISAEIKKLIELEDVPNRIRDLEVRNSEIQHKLKIFVEKGIDEKLKKQTSCNADLAKLNSILSKARVISTSFDNIFQLCDNNELTLEGYVSDYNQEIFVRAAAQITALDTVISSIRELYCQYSDGIAEFDKIVESLKEKIDSLKEEFAQIKRDIDDETIDVDSFVSYQKQLTDNIEELKRLGVVLKDKENIVQRIKTLLNERNDSLLTNYKEYQDSVSAINTLQSQLHIEIVFKGDKSVFSEQLKKHFRGTGLNESKYEELQKKFSDFTAILEDYYIYGGNELKKICSDSMYMKIASKINENYEEILAEKCPNEIKITYHGKLLSRHSLGQRASALILFILTQNDSDIIIIDQPEDDLDNQVIYKELIQTIKDRKKTIQFIFATHNANIPVLGDAERIVTTEYDGDNKTIKLIQGTIDSEESHRSIVDIMEGGEEAFARRNQIYSSWEK